MRVLAVVDKFRGTTSAHEAARAIARACAARDHECVQLPFADGGEGLLEAFGGANRSTPVTGPLGVVVDAPWRLHAGTAVIEMARASGLVVAGGPDCNDPIAATSAGTGELVDAALLAGAQRIIVGLGGSASTDGGLGALEAITSWESLRQVELVIACDVETCFIDAARLFAPQKGATASEVGLLTDRLHALARRYLREFGVDVANVPGTGAAGGLAGMFAALGGQLVPGFDLVANELRLDEAVGVSDLVITGEGHLDRQSFEGKVVGGVSRLAGARGVAVAAIVGIADDDVRQRMPTWDLARTFGLEKAMKDPLWCIERAGEDLLSRFGST